MFKDWNVFLGNFADIEFCIVEEQNETLTTVAPPTAAEKDSPTAKGSEVTTQETETLYK